MTIKNTENRYGSVSKFFHWTIGLLFLLQFILVYYVLWGLPEKSPTAGALINQVHKPVGILILLLGIIFVIWRLMNIKPKFPRLMTSWEIVIAKLTHFFLYLAIFVMPITGLLMTEAAGRPPNFFGLYQIPQFMEKNEALGKFFFEFHEITSYVVIGLVVLHTLGALKHHLINRDNVLKRMLPFGD